MPERAFIKVEERPAGAWRGRTRAGCPVHRNVVVSLGVLRGWHEEKGRQNEPSSRWKSDRQGRGGAAPARGVQCTATSSCLLVSFADGMRKRGARTSLHQGGRATGRGVAGPRPRGVSCTSKQSTISFIGGSAPARGVQCTATSSCLLVSFADGMRKRGARTSLHQGGRATGRGVAGPHPRGVSSAPQRRRVSWCPSRMA
ncbi:MAG: hypothetical protein KatS3mg058_0136 [Roseiflexus sp.]|nr:MAG: hypothetical protein KatS3mg058_0136 [Roseiflexus sp.]